MALPGRSVAALGAAAAGWTDAQAGPDGTELRAGPLRHGCRVPTPQSGKHNAAHLVVRSKKARVASSVEFGAFVSICRSTDRYQSQSAECCTGCAVTAVLSGTAGECVEQVRLKSDWAWSSCQEQYGVGSLNAHQHLDVGLGRDGVGERLGQVVVPLHPARRTRQRQ